VSEHRSEAEARSSQVRGVRPLDGVRVIDAGTRISAPFCAGLLGELGAEVIKVEQPGQGDFMRTIGPFAAGDYSLFWAVEGRGRKGVTCDLRRREGQALFRRLLATADVVCYNFRPGTMEAWHVGPDDCDPRLVWVRISVFGQDGPYAKRPGLDRLGIGYGGLLHLTGYADRPPVRPGVTVSDYLTGALAADAALAALYERDVRGTDRGRVVDAPLYGAILRILEWTIAGHDHLGIVRGREGNRLANSAPIDNYPTADGKYVCIVAGSDANFRRLCAAMGRPELATEPTWATLAQRAARADEINGIVADWTLARTAADIEAACIAHDVPVGTAYSAADIAADPHMAARGDLITVDDPVLGPVRQQAPFPRIDGKQPEAPVGAPILGQHNEDVWCGLVGLTAAEFSEHRTNGVI
jgi:crotonobetainyl-CoA:carnitine CoA-transferase CaiB-like acyl-CoA transferase